MNCQDLSRIVDCCDVNELSAAERRACEEHATTCRQCGPHWIAFAGLAAIPVPSMPQEVAMRCEALAAIESRAANVRAASRRVVLISAIVALAAAAAMLAWRHADQPQQPAVAEVSAPPPLPPPSVDAGATSDGDSPVEVRPAEPKAAVRPVEVVPEAVVASAPAPQPEPTVRYTVVATLRQDATDPDARAVADTFFGHVLDELRKVPGLKLRVRNSADQPPPGEGEFGLTIATLATEKAANGFTSFRGSSGQGSFNGSMLGYPWPLEWRVDEGGQTNGRPMSATSLLLARDGAPRPAFCFQPIIPENGSGTLCLTGAELAAREVEKLRTRDLPPDSAVFQQIAARVADSGMTERQRTVALNELLMAARRKVPPGLDATSMAAITRLVADAPSSRSLVWRLLRGTAVPGLVSSLLASLDAGTDESGRQEALTTLIADYADDPGVRAALQVVASDDPSELLRGLAGYALNGVDTWIRYVRDNLDRQGLSPVERVRPLVYASDEAAGSFQKEMLEAMARDAHIVEVVLTIARENQNETSVEQRGPLRRALYALTRSETGPVEPGSQRQEAQALYLQQTRPMSEVIQKLRESMPQ